MRYYDEQGVRRRKRCDSVAEAEFERARMALEQGQTGPLTAPADRLTQPAQSELYSGSSSGSGSERAAAQPGSRRDSVEPGS